MANIPGAVTDPSRVRGENVELKSGGDTIKGYLAQPSQSGGYPGIIVIHEAFGLVEHIRDIARRFANIGYNAIAPDLYSRKGGPSDPNDINTVFPVMFGKSDAEAAQDLEAAADHLRGLPGATNKVGVIGFCSGGRPTPILDMVDRLHCPLFAVFGEEDQNPTVAQSEELRSRAQRTSKDVTIKVYKNAGHAFLADYRPSYREGPAVELWQDVVAFFDKHLK